MYRNVDILILWRVSFHSEKFPPQKMYVEIMLSIFSKTKKSNIFSLEFSIWPLTFMCLQSAWELKRPSASLGGQGGQIYSTGSAMGRLRYKKRY